MRRIIPTHGSTISATISSLPVNVAGTTADSHEIGTHSGNRRGSSGPSPQKPLGVSRCGVRIRSRLNSKPGRSAGPSSSNATTVGTPQSTMVVREGRRSFTRPTS